ncbi:hypothetical protein HY256_04095, partial [Candidatus Sumerlaeota bacterium]|nr:hypothetical protein [Candidatus Sumerlaeota bacterium]
AGLLCLLIGTPIWILDLLGGSPFIPTSPLTHVLGPILGFYGVRKMGIPRWSWLASLGFVAAMIVVARLVTPADANVNLAFGPAPSWHWAPKAWPLHVGWMLGFWGGLLFVLELIVRKLCNHQPHPSAI